MKTLKLKVFALVLLLAGWTGTYAQATLGAEVPGDHFSLEGALELFKKSQSPQQFEEMLNSPDHKVNNLDLNNDGYTDYVRVIDRNEGNVHAFIIQAVISDTENQDIAVIELEKLDNGEAVLQITGDADVYGIETIIEPTEEVRINAGTSTARTVVNVWTWPSVQYVYSPSYAVWISPWSWAYRPFWWRPWRPVAYYVYDPWWRPYRPYYSVCHSHRIGYLPRLYRPYRCTSVVVYNNYRHDIDRYRSRNNGRDRDDERYGASRSRYDDNRNSRTRSADDYNRRHNDTRNRADANASPSYDRPEVIETSRPGDRRHNSGTERRPSIRQTNVEQSRSQLNRSSEQRHETSLQRSGTEGSMTNRPNVNASPTDSRFRSVETDRSGNRRQEVRTERSPAIPQTSIERSRSQLNRSYEQRSEGSRPQRSSAPRESFERSSGGRSTASPARDPGSGSRNSGNGNAGRNRGRD